MTKLFTRLATQLLSTPQADEGEADYSDDRITEAGEQRITEAGEQRDTEGETVWTPAQVLGSKLRCWYEIGLSPHTLNGANFSQIDDLGSGAYHLTQGTAANQPLYNASGGPNDRPYLSFNDADDRIGNTTVAITSGRDLTFFAVVKLTAGVTSAVVVVRDGNSESLGDAVFAIQKANGPDRFRPSAKAAGQAEQSPSLTTPAFDTDWNIWALQYPIGSAPIVRIAGSTGKVSGTDAFGYAAPGGTEAVDYIGIGHPTVAGHAFYALLCGENVTAQEYAGVIAYLTSRTGAAW